MLLFAFTEVVLETWHSHPANIQLTSIQIRVSRTWQCETLTNSYELSGVKAGKSSLDLFQSQFKTLVDIQYIVHHVDLQEL